MECYWLYLYSSTTVQEVIRILLGKFHIVDNPHKFALYERLETPVEGRKPTGKEIMIQDLVCIILVLCYFSLYDTSVMLI